MDQTRIKAEDRARGAGRPLDVLLPGLPELTAPRSRRAGRPAPPHAQQAGNRRRLALACSTVSLVFGRYEKIRRIAQGGMGDVYLARQTGVLDRLAILKCLREDFAADADLVEQFLDEARVAATLNHPNIVSIFDVGEWHGTYYIAMEYVPGEDLSKLWYAAAKAGVGLPFQVSVRICCEAAQGLAHAHKAKDVRGVPLNIVHRDVSPQNIMVRGDGVVKLVDFGIAKAANKASRTQAGMVKGKLQYMSPEQVRGETLDGRSDQFSLGIVLWEMCTGRRLFKADSEINTLQKILKSPIAKPSDHVPGFPPELEATIVKMLQRDAARRFKDLNEVAAELKTYLDRSSLAGSDDTTVSGFVQQILGKELEERVADLTPMENTEAVALSPNPQGAAIAKPAPNDAPTIVVTEDMLDAQKPAAVGGSWAVRMSDGKVVPFGDMPVLHKWIIEGLVVGDDQVTADGKVFKKLKDVPQLLKFFEIAIAGRSPTGPSASVEGDSSPPQPPLSSTRDPQTITWGVTQGSAGASLQAGAFELGVLPQSQTGTWGAPDIARALDAARAAKAAGSPRGEALTPTTRSQGGAPPAGTDMVKVPTATLPTAAWGLGGMLAVLALVSGGLAAFWPEFLTSLIHGTSAHTEVIKATAAARYDDPSAIDALLKAMEPLAAQATGGAAADAFAAAALLHLARARIDEETRNLSALVTEQGGAALPSAAKAALSAEAHRVQASQLVTRAVAGKHNSAGALLATAAYHGERGEWAEREAQASNAMLQAKGSSIEALVTSELALVRALAAAQMTARKTAVPLRAAAAQLAIIDDPRARSAARVLRAHACALGAATGEQAARDDVSALRSELRSLDLGDPRVASLAALTKLLDSKLALKKPDDVVTRPAGIADAGVALADAVDAGPPVPETFATSLAKAKKAAGARRAREAAKWAKRALELSAVEGRPPGDPAILEAQIILGFAYIDIDGLEGASQVFKQVLAAEPTSCEGQIGLASVFDLQQKTEDARKQYMSYVEKCPGGKDVEAAKGAISRLE